MSTRQRKKSYIRPLVIPLIALGFTGYFAWHGWHGSFGIEARRQLDADFARLKEQHLAIAKERADLERKVSLLRAQSLESDMLDERAREILGFAQRDEIVVYRAATTASLPAPVNKK
jgi:cell division protein FtsB